MLSVFLWIALLFFIAWIVLVSVGLAFHGLINILWVVIVIAFVIWLWNMFTGGHSRKTGM